MPKPNALKRPLTRPRRFRGINAKLTPSDHDLIAAKAETRRLTPTEWTRSVLLHLAGGPDPEYRILLEEVLAMRQLLVNVVSYLATDGAIPSKLDLKTLAVKADGSKFQKAQAALERIEDLIHSPTTKETR